MKEDMIILAVIGALSGMALEEFHPLVAGGAVLGALFPIGVRGVRGLWTRFFAPRCAKHNRPNCWRCDNADEDEDGTP